LHERLLAAHEQLRESQALQTMKKIASDFNQKQDSGLRYNAASVQTTPRWSDLAATVAVAKAGAVAKAEDPEFEGARPGPKIARGAL
jgi:uncharacterized RmlC-like cupin family protein